MGGKAENNKLLMLNDTVAKHYLAQISRVKLSNISNKAIRLVMPVQRNMQPLNMLNIFLMLPDISHLATGANQPGQKKKPYA